MTRWRGEHFERKYSLLLCLFVVSCRLQFVQSRGGGSKRTFGSPKSQNSPNQQTVDCSDQQQSCASEQSDSSWSSAFGATMALFGPLLVLLTFIIMIKFCFYNSYPKGQLADEHLPQGAAVDNKKIHLLNEDENPHKQMATTKAASATTCCCCSGYAHSYSGRANDTTRNAQLLAASSRSFAIDHPPIINTLTTTTTTTATTCDA